MSRRRRGQGDDHDRSEGAVPALPAVRQGPALALGVVVGIVLVVAVLLAVVQNDDDVRVEWLTVDVDAPLWLLLLIALAVGALLSAVGRSLAHRARARRHRHSAVHTQPEDSVPRTVRTFP